MSTLIFKIRKIKSVFPPGKLLKKFVDEKIVSAPRKYTEVFRKIQIKKMRFQVQKYEKYLKSKNDPERPRGAFLTIYEKFMFFLNPIKF